MWLKYTLVHKEILIIYYKFILSKVHLFPQKYKNLPKIHMEPQKQSLEKKLKVSAF